MYGEKYLLKCVYIFQGGVSGGGIPLAFPDLFSTPNSWSGCWGFLLTIGLGQAVINPPHYLKASVNYLICLLILPVKSDLQVFTEHSEGYCNDTHAQLCIDMQPDVHNYASEYGQ